MQDKLEYLALCSAVRVSDCSVLFDSVCGLVLVTLVPLVGIDHGI